MKWMDEGRWIMQGQIGRRTGNRNIALEKDKGLGDVIGDIAICNCDIALGDRIADGKG